MLKKTKVFNSLKRNCKNQQNVQHKSKLNWQIMKIKFKQNKANFKI